jgi:hypothetical protein
MAEQILFDRLAYLDRLKRAGIPEDHARAHAEAIDEALRESVATKRDLREQIELLRRDMMITTGTASIALFAALVGIKFFG